MSKEIVHRNHGNIPGIFLNISRTYPGISRKCSGNSPTELEICVQQKRRRAPCSKGKFLVNERQPVQRQSGPSIAKVTEVVAGKTREKRHRDGTSERATRARNSKKAWGRCVKEQGTPAVGGGGGVEAGLGNSLRFFKFKDYCIFWVPHE